MREGYDRDIKRRQTENIEAWRQARFIAFNSVKPHLKNQNMRITDFMELPGDKEQQSEDAKLAVQKEHREAIEHYKKMGWLKATA